MAALETVRALEGRAATADEQAVLARWGSWGAIPQVFDEQNSEWAGERERLRTLLTEREWEQARRTTVNAHYTDPAYVGAVWEALDALGFDGGAVLEPGCGAGTFLGLAPARARMVGVELDPTTAGIASALYPQADVRAESFADSRLRRDSFDATVGNVPFADVQLHDPAFNPARLSMHNHFIVKSLALTRPGGMVAVLTSSYTLDAQNPAARRAMNEYGDLVGAVRLPTGAHRRAAGTDAVTDLVIFRRREPDREPADRTWETTTRCEVDGQQVKINPYFLDHPDRVLGTLRVGHGMYGEQTLRVAAEDLGQTPVRLRTALEEITGQAHTSGHVFTPASALPAQQRREQATPESERTPSDLWDGTIVANAHEEGFQVAHGGALQPLTVPQTQARELRALVGLRDRAQALLEAEAATTEDTDEIDAMRDALRGDYEAYVRRFGPINRYTQRRTGRTEAATDPETGAPLVDDEGEQVYRDKLARVTPGAVRTLRQDPYGPLVLALENFDDETQQAAPAHLLEHRVVAPRVVPDGADTPEEALAMSLDATGEVDLALVGHLLGVEHSDARGQLGTLVYDDPDTGQLMTAPEYLSGNVRAKLDTALEAAAANDRWQVNVDALRDALPETIGAEEIEAKLGAVWISPEIHQQFLADVLQDSGVRVHNPLPGTWEVRGARSGVLATSEWGTERKPAVDIAEAVMQQSRVTVNDTVEDAEGRKRDVLNPVETTAAQEKATALQERFSEWVWEDPERAAGLVEEYNRRFNSIVLRDYTQAGAHLTFPGMAVTLQMREHQRAAVARMISEPAVGLFHQTGAGKTFEMIAGVSELKRMGLVNKPAVVVPNHMLEQFTREWLQAYPTARVLAAGSADLQGDKRRLFTAKAAANEWDGIVLTQEAFKALGVSKEYEQRYIDAEMAEMREAIEQAREAGASRIKQLEKQVMQREEKHKRRLEMRRDPGVGFEQTGIDYLCVDEAHGYKNLETLSHIPDARIEGSQQATDLHMKMEWLREQQGQRVGTLATATPLANSITEAHVMQRYLRPDLLEQAGITSFDGWAATFGSQVTEMEMGPAGGFRLKTRFAKFQNVPEMLRMWHVFADVQTSEDLNLPTPDVAARAGDGKREPENVTLEATPEVAEYIAEIGERAEQVAARAVDPTEDNMLKISTDGRKAALDLRLVDESAEQTGTVKLDVVAQRILSEWQDTRDLVYADDTGQESPIRGGMQLVFCDLGTPTAEGWDAYTELRDKLVEGGMPHHAVRFMHEAGDDNAKARLFAAARAGHVAVLVGSTAKMGVGTNVQDRITALHHVDCPWRPADLEQREGRAIRQGNQNGEVSVHRYVVEGSFDAYSWQTVTRKATFISQVMRGRLDQREIEDIGDTALSASEAKALASGNPLLMEKATADAELAKLRRQRTAHDRAQRSLRVTRDQESQKVTTLTDMLDQLQRADQQTVDTSGEAFTMTIEGRAYDSRSDAAEALGAWARRHRNEWDRPGGDPVPAAHVGGHTLTLATEYSPLHDKALTVLALQGVPRSSSQVDPDEVAQPSIGMIRAVENKTTAISKTIHTTQADIEKARATADEAEHRLGQPFAHADALDQAERKVADIDAQLAETAHATEEQPQESTDASESAAEPTEEPHPNAAHAAAVTRASFPHSPGEATRRTGDTPTPQPGSAPPGREPDRSPHR